MKKNLCMVLKANLRSCFYVVCWSRKTNLYLRIQIRLGCVDTRLQCVPSNCMSCGPVLVILGQPWVPQTVTRINSSASWQQFTLSLQATTLKHRQLRHSLIQTLNCWVHDVCMTICHLIQILDWIHILNIVSNASCLLRSPVSVHRWHVAHPSGHVTGWCTVPVKWPPSRHQTTSGQWSWWSGGEIDYSQDEYPLNDSHIKVDVK